MSIAETALGTPRARDKVVGRLDGLPALPVAAPNEVRVLVEARGLHGRGIGRVDASLVASCRLVPGAWLWTRDRRLDAVTASLGVRAADPSA